LGIPAKLDEIFCSAYSAAVYIARVLKIEKGKRVYVIGEEGIEQELEAEGVEWFGGTDPAESGPMTAEDYDSFEPDPTVAVVLCGLDRNIGYRKIARAWQFLQNPDTVFLATNSDPTYPTNGRLFPGAGACAAALVCMSGKTPLSLGKPSTAMMDAIEGRFKFDRKRACMVGDRLDTDVSFGVYGGLGGTLAVLTGVVKEHELLGANTEVVPSAYLDSLMDLLAAEEVDSS
jgi:4-nitrophenyl phosphatase